MIRTARMDFKYYAPQVLCTYSYYRLRYIHVLILVS